MCTFIFWSGGLVKPTAAAHSPKPIYPIAISTLPSQGLYQDAIASSPEAEETASPELHPQDGVVSETTPIVHEHGKSVDNRSCGEIGFPDGHKLRPSTTPTNITAEEKPLLSVVGTHNLVNYVNTNGLSLYADDSSSPYIPVAAGSERAPEICLTGDSLLVPVPLDCTAVDSPSKNHTLASLPNSAEEVPYAPQSLSVDSTHLDSVHLPRHTILGTPLSHPINVGEFDNEYPCSIPGTREICLTGESPLAPTPLSGTAVDSPSKNHAPPSLSNGVEVVAYAPQSLPGDSPHPSRNVTPGILPHPIDVGEINNGCAHSAPTGDMVRLSADLLDDGSVSLPRDSQPKSGSFSEFELSPTNLPVAAPLDDMEVEQSNKFLSDNRQKGTEYSLSIFEETPLRDHAQSDRVLDHLNIGEPNLSTGVQLNHNHPAHFLGGALAQESVSQEIWPQRLRVPHSGALNHTRTPESTPTPLTNSLANDSPAFHNASHLTDASNVPRIRVEALAEPVPKANDDPILGPSGYPIDDDLPPQSFEPTLSSILRQNWGTQDDRIAQVAGLTSGSSDDAPAADILDPPTPRGYSPNFDSVDTNTPQHHGGAFGSTAYQRLMLYPVSPRLVFRRVLTTQTHDPNSGPTSHQERCC